MKIDFHEDRMTEKMEQSMCSRNATGPTNWADDMLGYDIQRSVLTGQMTC